jgi:YHS domain-containing protein
MVRRLVILFAFCGFPFLAQAQKPEIYSASGAAIRGYDPVAYFADGKPVKGSEKFSYRWKGATWHFASQDNRDKFAAAPDKFAPQYGGYCAYGVAGGYAVSIDPAAWSVRDGKLYLNYSAGVQKDWLKDVPGYIRKADANWPRVLR